MTHFVINQVVSWMLVMQCYWVVHQTSVVMKNTIAGTVMRWGVTGVGIGIAVNASTLLLYDMVPNVNLAIGDWAAFTAKVFASILLFGVIVFHKNRWGRL